jgi:hypothetical protein
MEWRRQTVYSPVWRGILLNLHKPCCIRITGELSVEGPVPNDQQVPSAKFAACSQDVHYQNILRALVRSEDDLEASGDLDPRLSGSCLSSHTGLLP